MAVKAVDRYQAKDATTNHSALTAAGLLVEGGILDGATRSR
jgi:hypothetical protein